MTIFDLLDKNEIAYKKIKGEKAVNIFKIKDRNIIFWVNSGNAFKMKRSWFDILEKDCDKYALILVDTVGKKYYYLNFSNKNNWLSGSFRSCDKAELFLGKQVLNNTSTLSRIVADLKK